MIFKGFARSQSRQIYLDHLATTKRVTATVAFVASVSFVAAHYTFPDFVVNGTTSSDWQYVRETANHWSNGPVTNVTDPEFRCYELDLVNTASQTQTATVTANVGFRADAVMGHPGYFSAYMAPANPAANSALAATGNTWFKIWEWAPRWAASTGLVFDSENVQSVNFTIPKSLPSGQYLLRLEQIALHAASTYGGAQFYIGCAQVNVVGGGKGKPGPTVAIPGVYTGYEPGILINIYVLPKKYTGYQAPGPAVWQG